MKIELASLKRIAKAVPELTVAQLVAVWAEKIEEQKRETERERIAERRQQLPTSANNDQQPPTREEQEKALFQRARQICGRNAGGMVSILLKAHRYDLAAVSGIFDQAQTKADPKEYVAAQCRKTANGARHSNASIADDLIARAESGEGNPDFEAANDLGFGGVEGS